METKLVPVDRFESPWQAHIAAGRLEAEGIPAAIRNQFHIWANWPMSQALGWVIVDVFERDKYTAAAILKQHKAGEFQQPLAEDFPDTFKTFCSNCHLDKIKIDFSGSERILCILFCFFGANFPTRRDVTSCLNCGNTWRI